MLFIASDGKSRFVDLDGKIVQETSTTTHVERRGVTYCAASGTVITNQTRGCASFFTPCRQQPVQRCFTPEPITCSACTMDGVFFLGGSAAGNLYVWNTLSGQLLHLIRAHGRQITDIAFSTDQSLVVTASEDSVCKTWLLSSLVARRANTPGERSLFTGHTLSVNACSFMETGYLVSTGSSDRTCRIFDGLTGQQQLVITVNDPLTSVRSSPGDEILLLGSETGSLFFVHLYTASAEQRLPTNSFTPQEENVVIRKPFSEGHEGPIVFIWFDMTRPGCVIVGSANGVVLWWNSTTASIIGKMMEPLSGGLTSICYVPRDALFLLPPSLSRVHCAALAKHPVDPSTTDFSIVALLDENDDSAVRPAMMNFVLSGPGMPRRRQRQECELDMEQRVPDTRENGVGNEKSSASCDVNSRTEAIKYLQEKNSELLTLRDRLRVKLLKLTPSS